jgi:hypothetical protein
MKTTKPVTLSPAALVIREFGGVRELARILKISASSVSRWRSEGGDIPSSQIARVWDLIKQKKLRITAEELFSGRVV